MARFIQALAIFALIAGLFFVTIGTHALMHIALSRSWVQVPGKVLFVKKVVLDMSLGKPGNARTTKANVRYAYEYGGQRYEQDRVYFSRPGGESPYYYPIDVGEGFRVGQELAVFVDPTNPSEAVLDRSLRRPIRFLLLGVAFIAVWGARLKFFSSDSKPDQLTGSTSTLCRAS